MEYTVMTFLSLALMQFFMYVARAAWTGNKPWWVKLVVCLCAQYTVTMAFLASLHWGMLAMFTTLQWMGKP
jgi:hypothetical protein